MTRFSRATLSSLAVVGAVVALAACGSSSSSTSSSPGAASSGTTAASSTAAATSATTAASSGAGITVGYSDTIGSNANNAAQNQGAEVQAKGLGMGWKYTDANLDPNKQLSDVNTLIDEGVKAILIGELDANALRPVLAKARAKGIVIVTLSQPNGSGNTNVQPEDYQSAYQEALFAAKTVAKGSGVGIIEGLPVVGVLQARNLGMAAGAKAAGLKILVSQVNTMDTAAGAQPIVNAWKVKYGSQMKVILAYNDPSALGAVATRGGSFQPVIMGFNASPEGVQAVQKGLLLGTMDAQPVLNGNTMSWLANQIIVDHKTFPANIYHVEPVIDKSNASQWQSYSQLLKAPMQISITTVDGKATVTQPTP